MKGTFEEAKKLDGKVQAVSERASLFVRKVVVTVSVKLSIEKALAKSHSIYPHIESLSKSFIIQAGQDCFVKANLSGTEPIRRVNFCLVKNSLFRSAPLKQSRFSYQKFGVQCVEIQLGNGVPLAGTPLDTRNNVLFNIIQKQFLGSPKMETGYYWKILMKIFFSWLLT